MRLRSNHVLPDPNQVAPLPRRRRQTRASSAQPTEPATESATTTARAPVKKVTKKTRGKKNTRKAKTESPEPEIPTTSTSPAPSPVISQTHSPLAATPAVQSIDDSELETPISPQNTQDTPKSPQHGPNEVPIPPEDFPPVPETLLGASLFSIEELDEPDSPFQQRSRERARELQRERIAERDRIQQRILARIAENQRAVEQDRIQQQFLGLIQEPQRRAESQRIANEQRVRESQIPPFSLVNPQYPSLSPPEDEDEFFDADEIIDQKSASARRWLLHKKYSHLRRPEPLSPFSEDRKYRIMNNMDLPDPPEIWTKIKETQGLTYYEDHWGIKRVYQPDQPESSPAKRQKSSTASPAFLSSPRTRRASRKTYADRTRRRQIEANGRIDRTIFRLPELLAQQQADAAANTARLSSNSDDSIPPMTPPSAAPAPAPATVHANNANASLPRTIFNSLTRRWTSLWGRTPAEEEAAEQPIGTTFTHEILFYSSHHVSVEEPQTPRAQNIASDPPASAPSAYYAARSRHETSNTVTRRQTGNPRVRRRTNARPYYPSRNYDLYPRGFDEALLDRCFAGSTALGQRKVPAPSQQTQAHEKAKAAESESSNKRKRQPSPDVIPNPPGCSYGLHDDYFTYDDDDEAWAAEEQARRDAEKTSTVSLEPATKKARVNFNHAGHFEVPDSSDSESSILAQPPVTNKVSESVNKSGHFEVPESSESDDSSTNHSTDNSTENSTDNSTDNSTNISPTKSSSRKTQDARSKRSPSPLTKARRTAEQHKPKTPSRLRAAHRYSMDPVVMENLNKMMTSDNPAERERAATVLQACPTGDLRQIKWPKTKTWVAKIDLSWKDVNARDRTFNRFMQVGGLDYDKQRRDQAHERFKKSVAILAKARRNGQCAIV
ncbi:hypothetical protein PENANT_c002G01460 [Penicillium antarcticum]|uniref:Uncharacterized protein n=1 Tax=Penicillium antarcticum TaxID=416450 RepID=A0A1V6QJQ5_9EURO|nr:uncharacterized protein N7508_008506 [Penicillium antarcticum]KAJ5293685.1 hypothetical protein N7508_008506 [Penicillium antarcticum]OQD89479.1 hypothetical protein PENANT_c002G01460 [Penicillium antarcticum]